MTKKKPSPITPAEINQRNREFWADPFNQAAAQVLALAEHATEMAAAPRRRAKAAADARHAAPGGSRERQQAIRDAWASGKYSSRDLCAEEEARALGMSFSAARKALRNTPDPT